MNKLKIKREEKGLSQVEVAKQAQIDVRQYQRYEYDEREPKARLAMKIAKIMGTTVEELFP
ncbi:helix-turn-helix transcriptional regulator [Listeria monocytogenes]|uniref:helix-turn-helix transcriptional regulator n=1 Tax=Listeria monocytogenes TaxID=1639 RepID=UPI0011EB81FA|nr:helix-turn-helix transcriptional regulator [Listeria monocytogenes]TYU82205.1 helix-turn-helix transcriptional regulator [Listeria monocytogenes]